MGVNGYAPTHLEFKHCFEISRLYGEFNTSMKHTSDILHFQVGIREPSHELALHQQKLELSFQSNLDPFWVQWINF